MAKKASSRALTWTEVFILEQQPIIRSVRSSFQSITHHDADNDAPINELPTCYWGTCPTSILCYIFWVIVSPTYGEQRGWACMSVSSRPCLASQSIFGVFTRGLWNPTSFHPVKGNKTWLVVYAKKQLIYTYMHIKIVLKEGNKLWSTHLIINIIGGDKDRVYYFAYSSLGDAMAVNCSTPNTSGFFIKQRMWYSIITCAL